MSVECLEALRGGCEGPVAFRSTGTAVRAWPRCEAHQRAREARYEDSIDRWDYNVATGLTMTAAEIVGAL